MKTKTVHKDPAKQKQADETRAAAEARVARRRALKQANRPKCKQSMMSWEAS